MNKFFKIAKVIFYALVGSGLLVVLANTVGQLPN